jgi:hypothetical protein
MRDVFLGNSLGGSSPAQVDEFEEFIHTKLPSDYRNFLVNFNGGVPSPSSSLYRSGLELPGGSDIEVSQFFTLATNHPVVRNLHREIEANIGWLAMSSICIGADDFGNLICIDCENGQMQWLLLEARFQLDFARIFELGVELPELLQRLEAAAYPKS